MLQWDWFTAQIVCFIQTFSSGAPTIPLAEHRPKPHQPPQAPTTPANHHQSLAEVFLSKRVGFIKLALEQQSAVVPCYAFGSVDLYATYTKARRTEASQAKRFKTWGRKPKCGCPLEHKLPSFDFRALWTEREGRFKHSCKGARCSPHKASSPISPPRGISQELLTWPAKGNAVQLGTNKLGQPTHQLVQDCVHVSIHGITGWRRFSIVPYRRQFRKRKAIPSASQGQHGSVGRRSLCEVAEWYSCDIWLWVKTNGPILW